MSDEDTQLLKQYQKILKMCTEHMETCSEFEKQVIEGFDFEDDEKENVRTSPDPTHERRSQQQHQKGVIV